jgi:hypothetical protein
LERFRVSAGKPLTPEESEKFESFQKQYGRDERF